MSADNAKFAIMPGHSQARKHIAVIAILAMLFLGLAVPATQPYREQPDQPNKPNGAGQSTLRLAATQATPGIRSIWILLLPKMSTRG